MSISVNDLHLDIYFCLKFFNDLINDVRLIDLKESINCNCTKDRNVCIGITRLSVRNKRFNTTGDFKDWYKAVKGLLEYLEKTPSRPLTKLRTMMPNAFTIAGHFGFSEKCDASLSYLCIPFLNDAPCGNCDCFFYSECSPIQSSDRTAPHDKLLCYKEIHGRPSFRLIRTTIPKIDIEIKKLFADDPIIEKFKSDNASLLSRMAIHH
ncbi:MAG: hypothetical protein LBL98_05545 [Ruminococcus sp.]|jgi:hypothetical protein|nr:hypothetical protein [Ruminococcus sp.]